MRTPLIDNSVGNDVCVRTLGAAPNLDSAKVFQLEWLILLQITEHFLFYC